MKKVLSTTLLVFMLTLLFGAAVSAADVAVLISDYTKTWYEEVSWDFDEDMDCIRDTLDLADISYVEISDGDLAKGNFGDAKVLILPNNRRMSREQVALTREFLAEGGTLLALMQTSFKDETNSTVDENLFQLRDVFGLEYEAFAWKPPLHGYIKKVEDHPIFEGLPELVQFHRNWAMIVKHQEDAKILAEWYNDDQIMPSHLPEINAAILEGPQGNVIYVGEMMFMAVQMEDPQVRTLATNIINYLLEKSTRGQ